MKSPVLLNDFLKQNSRRELPIVLPLFSRQDIDSGHHKHSTADSELSFQAHDTLSETLEAGSFFVAKKGFQTRSKTHTSLNGP